MRRSEELRVDILELVDLDYSRIVTHKRSSFVLIGYFTNLAIINCQKPGWRSNRAERPPFGDTCLSRHVLEIGIG